MWSFCWRPSASRSSLWPSLLFATIQTVERLVRVVRRALSWTMESTRSHWLGGRGVPEIGRPKKGIQYWNQRCWTIVSFITVKLNFQMTWQYRMSLNRSLETSIRRPIRLKGPDLSPNDVEKTSEDVSYLDMRAFLHFAGPIDVQWAVLFPNQCSHDWSGLN